MNNGYIKLYRKVLDNPIIMKDSEHLAIWIYLLMEATHKEIDVLFKGKRTTLSPGQLLTGTKSIGMKLKIHYIKVFRILNEFESEKQIEKQASNKNTLITILKWNDYQVNEKQNEKQVKNNCKTSEKQLKTNNNIKNIKNDKNNKENISKDIQKKYFESLKVNTIFNEFLELRKKLKAVNTDRAINMLINKLNEYDEETQYKMIEQSIVNSWKGIFELKNKERKDNVFETLKRIYNE